MKIFYKPQRVDVGCYNPRSGEVESCIIEKTFIKQEDKKFLESPKVVKKHDLLEIASGIGYFAYINILEKCEDGNEIAIEFDKLVDKIKEKIAEPIIFERNDELSGELVEIEDIERQKLFLLKDNYKEILKQYESIRNFLLEKLKMR